MPEQHQGTSIISTASGGKQFEAMAKIQSEISKKIAEANRYWVDRWQSEAGQAADFTSKLATLHSIPDALTAWQEWNRRRLERMADDGKHLLADVQEIVTASRQLLTNGGV